MSKLRALTMPKWGIEMSEGILADWSVGEGEAFAKGQLLASVETDKIVNEIEADYASVCLRRVAEEGDTLAVGELLAVFGDANTDAADIDQFVQNFKAADTAFSGDDDEAPAVEDGADHAAAVPVDSTELPAGVTATASAIAAASTGGVNLADVTGSGREGKVYRQDVDRVLRSEPVVAGSPVDNAVRLADASVPANDVARRVAHTRGIHLTGIKGTGRNGRVRLRDLGSEAAAASGPVKFSAARVQIAKRLTASYRDIPHYHLQMDVSFDALMAARKAYNAGRDQTASLNDLIIRAVARSLEAHPQVNAHVFDSAMESFGTANVAMAVATENGLITPVVSNAATRPFHELCAASKDLVARAREGTLTREDLQGGTFTVSNLGMFGVHRFTAIINPPQAAILSVGAARREPMEKDGGVVFHNVVSLTLGCDHRAIDGAVGGQFLADLRDHISSPATLFD